MKQRRIDILTARGWTQHSEHGVRVMVPPDKAPRWITDEGGQYIDNGYAEDTIDSMSYADFCDLAGVPCDMRWS